MAGSGVTGGRAAWPAWPAWPVGVAPGSGAAAGTGAGRDSGAGAGSAGCSAGGAGPTSGARSAGVGVGLPSQGLRRVPSLTPRRPAMIRSHCRAVQPRKIQVSALSTSPATGFNSSPAWTHAVPANRPAPRLSTVASISARACAHGPPEPARIRHAWPALSRSANTRVPCAAVRASLISSRSVAQRTRHWFSGRGGGATASASAVVAPPERAARSSKMSRPWRRRGSERMAPPGSIPAWCEPPSSPTTCPEGHPDSRRWPHGPIVALDKDMGSGRGPVSELATVRRKDAT